MMNYYIKTNRTEHTAQKYVQMWGNNIWQRSKGDSIEKG
jgi:hypothetical protein